MPSRTPLPAIPAMPVSVRSRISQRIRRLARRGLMTPHEVLLAEAFLWELSSKTSGAIEASYTRLMDYAHQARGTVSKGLKTLEHFKILRKHKRTTSVAWANGGLQSRRDVNVYELIAPPDHEFTGRTVSKPLKILPTVPTLQSAKEALQKVAEVTGSAFLRQVWQEW
jgi:hypothetical protein